MKMCQGWEGSWSCARHMTESWPSRIESIMFHRKPLPFHFQKPLIVVPSARIAVALT